MKSGLKMMIFGFGVLLLVGGMTLRFGQLVVPIGDFTINFVHAYLMVLAGAFIVGAFIYRFAVALLEILERRI